MVVTIEMPRGTAFKYEKAKDSNTLIVDRVLKMEIPCNYGFVHDTLSGDGDPTDAFVVTTEPLLPLCQINFEPYFLIEMKDQGLEDNKYVGCISGDTPPTFIDVLNIVDYLNSYKKGVIIEKIITIMGGSP